jgi:hypothetical protein
LLLALLSLAGCDGGLFVEPAASPASLSISYVLGPAASSLGDAFDATDRIAVRVAGEGVDVERVLDFTPQAEVRVRVEVGVPGDAVPVEVQIELRRSSDPVFRGASSASLTSGQTSSVEVGLAPVPAGISLPASLPPITAIGDETVIDGAVTFATGDPIPGLPLEWSSSNTDVATVDAAGRVRATGEGTAQITATHAALSASVGAEVAAIVETIDVAPASSSVGVGQTLQLTASARDRNGNGLTRSFTWTSSSPSVASVDADGLVTAHEGGTATISASRNGASGNATVTVSEAPGAVSGSVSDFATQSPIPGASIAIRRAGDPDEVVVSPDANGSFELPNLVPGEYRMEARAPDHVTNVADPVRIDADPAGVGTTAQSGSAVRLDFALPTPGTPQPVGGFAGRVTDQGGQPLAGATVTISGGAQTNGVFRSVNTAADGTYTFPGVVLTDPAGQPIESFSIAASAGGFRTGAAPGLTIPANTTRANLDLSLSPGTANVFFDDGFEEELAWTTVGFWNRTTGQGITNTAHPQFVTLAPDDASGGALPSAPEGQHYMWYGEPATGNYRGEPLPGDPNKSGGHSAEPNSGALVSPIISLPSGAATVTLTFDTWFEIESVNPNQFGFDHMIVFLEVVGSSGLVELIRLNPFVDPEVADRDDLPFTSAGFNRAPIFRPVSVSLDGHQGQQIRLVFHFDTVDELHNGFRGWIVDHVRITDEPAPSSVRGPAPGVPTGSRRPRGQR